MITVCCSSLFVFLLFLSKLGVSKKTDKPIKPRKPEKKITKETEPKKKTELTD
jgi:hypothetical protein